MEMNMKYRINLMNLLLYFITTLPTLTLLIVTGNILKINYLTILMIIFEMSSAQYECQLDLIFYIENNKVSKIHIEGAD